MLFNEQYNTSCRVTAGVRFLAQCPPPCDDQIPFAHLCTRLLPFLSFPARFRVFFIDFSPCFVANEPLARQGHTARCYLWDQDTRDL